MRSKFILNGEQKDLYLIHYDEIYETRRASSKIAKNPTLFVSVVIAGVMGSDANIRFDDENASSYQPALEKEAQPTYRPIELQMGRTREEFTNYSTP